MALEFRQDLRLSQQLVMTPQLQQAIKLLQLSRQELIETIQQEMLENPVLEEGQDSQGEEENGDDETEVDASAGADGAGATDASAEAAPDGEVQASENIREIDWESFLDVYQTQDHRGETYLPTDDDERPGFENFTSTPTTLTDHLLWQLRLSNFTKEEERVGVLIIGNLNEDGYLTSTVEEIAADAELDSLFVAQVLKRVQQFDPVGVASRTLQEALYTQARLWGLDDGPVGAILGDQFALFEKRDVKALQKALKIPLDEVQEALRTIASMEPKPGRPFTDDDAQYIEPDIYVYKVGHEYVVVLNEDGLPKLRVNPYYRGLLANDDGDGDQTKSYVQEKLRSAVWLIKSIHQRQRTIYKVMESIIKYQRPFFDKGIGHLRPLVLKEVANDIGMHESTVSRVTTNKYVHTPQGIYPLKYFFNSGIQRVEGDALAAESVKDKIMQVIAGEKPEKPYSDQDIVNILKTMNIDIARRTVTKYRESMGILSSTRRRKMF